MLRIKDLRSTRRRRPAPAGALAVALAVPIALAVEVMVQPRPVFAVQKDAASLQLEFGVKVALKGSWLEAAFRFERAIKLGADTARAWNNLAVARESLGQYEQAREAYEKALALAAAGDDDDEKRIRENYDRLVGFLGAGRKSPSS